MLLKGICVCGRWTTEVELPASVKQLQPRVCDCDYCRANPSAIVSDPGMIASFTGDSYFVRQNGDELANFYHCGNCRQLLAVGCLFGKVLRGAVNSMLFKETAMFGAPIRVQPRLLSATEKKNRWDELWGELRGL